MASERVCPVCYLQQEREVFQFKECRHQFCRSCVRSHCVVRLKEFHVSVPCLYPNCSAQLTPSEVCIQIWFHIMVTWRKPFLDTVTCGWEGLCPVCGTDLPPMAGEGARCTVMSSARLSVRWTPSRPKIGVSNEICMPASKLWQRVLLQM